MIERVVYLGSSEQLVIRLATGDVVQALVVNDGTLREFAQGTAVQVHLPAEALRVLPAPAEPLEHDARRRVGRRRARLRRLIAGRSARRARRPRSARTSSGLTSTSATSGCAAAKRESAATAAAAAARSSGGRPRAPRSSGAQRERAQQAAPRRASSTGASATAVSRKRLRVDAAGADERRSARTAHRGARRQQLEARRRVLRPLDGEGSRRGEPSSRPPRAAPPRRGCRRRRRPRRTCAARRAPSGRPG